MIRARVKQAPKKEPYMAKLKVPGGLSGPGGLIAAVISRAVTDSTSGSYEIMVSAWAYLGGPLFCHHLELIGLPPDTMPEVIAEMCSSDVVEIFEHIKTEGAKYYETQEQIKRSRTSSRTNGRNAGQGEMAR